MATKVNLDSVCKPSPSYIFPFSSRRYRQLAAEGILPPVEGGKIDFPLACRTLFEHQQELIEGRGSLTLTDEKKRKTRLEADRKEFELQKLRGEFIRTDQAMRLWGSVCFQIRSKLLAIPVKISPLVFALKSIPEIKDRLEVAVCEALNEISNPNLEQIARMGGSFPNPGDAKTTIKAKRVGVGRRKKVSKPGVKRGTGKVLHRAG